ncbi:MAG: elongation factor P maturation arginine rhamnosyltransferase EarP [Pseudomonadota bacterium]|nr:elongation factor P maturation arginine rhamnosyltransferase EarP [Pseudomonadota bacterium]
MPLPPSANHGTGTTWDLFCRVVDNHGDVGVCWRLAADLASRGIAVRLWIDDARALAWMAPAGRAGVEVLPWPATDSDVARAWTDPAGVVIEAFGCGLPEPYLRYLADADRRSTAPVWINLEYLTAEPYAERSHKLPSPRSAGTARGSTTWFFYPGFTTRTGGLLREPDLMQRLASFEPDTWLADHDIEPRPDERLVSLFCYANPNLPGLLRALAAHPTLLLTTPGHATEQVEQTLAAAAKEVGGRPLLRTQAVPWLSQTGYDHLLWSCDLNFVRGEDSLVRAIWAGRPFVWQIYPQDDEAHAFKLAAFLAQMLASMDRPRADSIRRVAWRWNGLDRSPVATSTLPKTPEPDPWSALNSPAAMAAWNARCVSWRTELLDQTDLVTQLMGFVAARRSAKDAKI